MAQRRRAHRHVSPQQPKEKRSMFAYARRTQLLVAVALHGSAHAETVKPVRMSNADLAGAIFARANVMGKAKAMAAART